MKQRIFLTNFSERLFLTISCVQNAVFQCKKGKLDVDCLISENEIDESQSISDDSTITIRLKPKVEKSNIERVEIPIQRTISIHKYCCLCSAAMNLTVILEEVRMQSYIKMKIHIPAGNRCCRTHLIKDRFYDEDLGLLKVYSNSSSVSPSELSKMMESLSIKCYSILYDKLGDYSLSQKQLLIFTGLNWENIIFLKDFRHVP